MVECRRRYWRAAQICMQDYARCVDYGAQRKAERGAEFAFDGCGKTADSEFYALFVKAARGNFSSHAVEHGARSVGNGGAAVALGHGAKVRSMQQFVHRGQFAEQRGLGSLFHGQDYDMCA
jgi:hypothetical protein